MCNKSVEIDMSVDELLIVSNDNQQTNDQIIEKIELNNEINKLTNEIIVKSDQQVNHEINSNDLIKENNLKEERTNQNEISKNKSIDNQNIKEQKMISSLNVQQILNQINQDSKLEQKNDNNQQVIQQNNNKIKLKQLNNQQDSTKTIDIESQKSQNSSLNESIKLTNEIEMNADESLNIKIINLTNKSIEMNADDESSLHIKPFNLTNKSTDMSIDNESLVLNDIRHIFDTSNEFIMPKPLKKTPIKKQIKFKNNNNKENKMDISCSDNNDSLVLKDIKIENNSTDCLDNSPYLKSLPSPKPVFKLSRKRLNCETESPIKKLPFISNLFKNQIQQQQQTTPLISTNKKWRSATYNPMTSSPKKMELISPLKIIDNNIINSNKLCSNINNTIDNLLFSNLDMIIQKSDHQPNLMGDYTSTYALPLINGRHKDLKTISPETLANLMNGEYSKSIGCFTIIDSRYPYEYEGGHIDGSKNIYTKDDINKYFFGTDKPTIVTSKLLINTTIDNNSKQSSSNLMQRNLNNNQIKNSTKINYLKRLSVIKEGCSQQNDENSENKQLIKIKTDNELNNCINDNTQQLKRHAIIFHCEFSSERAPSMCRYLRKVDRELNESCYPNLYYPEVYLLHGGYKSFYEKFKNLCYPQTYLPMHSSDHKQDLIKFRTKSKSWSGDRKWKSVAK